MLKRRDATLVLKKEQPQIKRKGAVLKPSVFSAHLKEVLPGVLSSSILTGEATNIVQIRTSPNPNIADIGFDVVAWNEEGVSKLYLENLSSSGKIDEKLKVTDPEVMKLVENSGRKKLPPDTIFVKLAGDSESRMAVKQMVLGWLDAYKKSLALSNRPVLKETDAQVINRDREEFCITFSVKGITQIDPIMGLDTYLQNYSHVFSDELRAALTTYQNKLKAGVVTGFRVEEVAATPDRKGILPPTNVAEARGLVQDIEKAAKSLQETIVKEIANKKQTKLTKSELATLTTLQEQLNSAIEDKFKNELDTRRRKEWLTPNTLTEDQIVPGTGGEQGSGAQGSVFKYELDPASRRSPVVLKYDNIGLNGDALGAGIPELNPQQSVRAVASFKISKQLGMVVIPRTEFFVGTDADGRPILGQAMEVVNGPAGQRKAGIKNDAITGAKAQRLNDLLSIWKRNVRDEEWVSAELEMKQFYYDGVNEIWYPTPPIIQNERQAIQDAENIVNNPDNHTPQDLAKAKQTLDKYVPVNGQWYRPKILPVNIEYGNPVVQQGLSDLQVFDCIIGHADRNASNWIYEKKGNDITGVKGIDNDDTFGKDWSPMKPQTTGEWSSKTPGVPPIVDISTARSILNADFNKDIRPLLADLSDEEIKIAANRFDQVQQEVVQRVKSGKIASMGDDAAGDQAKLGEIRNKIRVIGPMRAILRWGDQTAGDHTEQNSYLGTQIAQKNLMGVAPESGVGLAVLPAEPMPQLPALPLAQPLGQQQVQLPAQQQAQLPDQFPPLPVVPNQ